MDDQFKELSRRRFLKGVGGAAVVARAAAGLGAEARAEAVSVADVPNAGRASLQARDSSLVLGNRQVELKIDRQTGFFQEIFNKLEGTGVWPFGMRLGGGWHRYRVSEPTGTEQALQCPAS